MTGREQKAKVYHAELWGSRPEKYARLEESDWRSTKWKTLRPKSEFYLFVPRDERTLAQYQSFLKITDLFPVSSTGIKTHRDHFVIDFDKEALKRRIRTFLDPNLPDELVRESLKLKDNRDWKLAEKRKLIQQDKDWHKKLIPCLYRPFDTRYLFYHPHAIDFGREEVMRHMLCQNLCLCSGRAGQVVGEEALWNLVLCANSVQDHNAFYRGGVVSFPLYLYPRVSKDGLLTHSSSEAERELNLDPALLAYLQTVYKTLPLPEVVFYYLYTVFHSNLYRAHYAEFLRLDFPRIPFTKDAKLFQKLAALGERLVDLHLLRSSKLDPPIARFEGEGDGKVQTGRQGLRYESKTERVYINPTQYFEGVPPEVWEYPIGGYPVCRKWLKDRKERVLSLDEIKTYCRVVTALSKTIEVQAEIDKLYPKVEETLLAIELERK